MTEPSEFDNKNFKIGSQLRIRLPKDYIVEESSEMLAAQDQYNLITLQEVTKRFAESKLYEDIFKKSIMDDMLFMGYVPLTRWEKFKYRLQDYKQRVKDIWTILTGGDVHEDCNY